MPEPDLIDGANAMHEAAYQLVLEIEGGKCLRELGIYLTVEEIRRAMNAIVADRPKNVVAIGVRTVRVLYWGNPDKPYKYRIEPITPPRRKIIFKKKN